MTIFSDLKSQSNVESMGSDLTERNVLALSGRSDLKKRNVLALSWRSDLKKRNVLALSGRSDSKKTNVLALSWGRIRRKRMFWRCPGVGFEENKCFGAVLGSDSKKTNVLALSWGRIRRKQMFWRCPGYKKSFYEKIRQEMALVRSIPVGFHIKRAEFCFLLSSVDLFGGRNENNIQFRVRHIRQAYTLCSEGAFC